jgi:hypothetical protein
MLSFKDFEKINESATKDLPDKVSMLVDAFISSDSSLSVDPWPEIVIKDKKVDDRFLGIRMYTGDTLFRINWKEGSTAPSIIDVWLSSGKNEIMPKYSIIGNFNLFKMMSNSLLDVIKDLSGGKLVKEFTKSLVAESKSDDENELVTGNPKIINAPRETTDDTVQPQSDFEDDEIAVFDELRSLVIMVMDNINPSLIITGRGGIGKTHTVTSTFKEYDLVKDVEYTIIRGASTALSLYKALYTNNGKIIVFDDCDSIFKDADGVNILKAALDSYDEREISWLSRSTYDPQTQSPTEARSVPNRFVFEGQIIFISNLDINQIDPAVRTRSYTININLSEQQVFAIMEKSLPNILPNVDITTKREVLNFLKTEYSASEEMVNMRTLIKAIKIRLSGAPNWKKLASKYA